MAGLEERGLELYTDNYYTSPDLYTTLYENACGTLRVNRRGFPKELVYERNRNEERASMIIVQTALFLLRSGMTDDLFTSCQRCIRPKRVMALQSML